MFTTDKTELISAILSFVIITAQWIAAIVDTDLWDLNTRDQSATVAPMLDKNLAPLINAAKLSPRGGNSDVSFSATADNNKSTSKDNVSIFMPLIKSFGSSFLCGSFLKLFHDVLVFIASILLRRIIDYAKPACDGTTSGEIVNLMSHDCQKIGDLVPYLNMLWSSPVQISIAIYMLYEILGASVFAGLVVMFVLIPVNEYKPSQASPVLAALFYGALSHIHS